MLGLVKDLLPPVVPDTRPLKRWGRIDTGVLLHERMAPEAPSEPGTWAEVGADVHQGDAYVNGAWVTLEKTEAYWRNWRDAELAATDWMVTRATETGDPLPQEWIDYRQALRDIPEQQGFPVNVTRPVQP